VKGINKKEAALIASLHAELEAGRDKYNALSVELNAKLFATLTKFKDDYESELIALELENTVITNKLSALTLIETEKMESYIDNRSDSWHDSDAGCDFINWYDEWVEFQSSIEDELDFGVFNGVDLWQSENVKKPSNNRNSTTD
jgi:hypothetical protein